MSQVVSKANMRFMRPMILALVLVTMGLSAPATSHPAASQRDYTLLLYCDWNYSGCYGAWFYSEEVTVVASYGQLDIFPGGSWGYSGCPDCMRMVENYGPAPQPVEGGGGEACAIPTDFHQVGSGTDSGSGTLHFEYTWSSSTGNKADLSACEMGERVSGYTANPFPSPPFKAGLSPSDPTELSFEATRDAEDNHQTPGPFVTPFTGATVTASQIYRYRCPCNNNNAWVTLMGPHDIVRTVTENGSGGWKFVISKSGSSATINPLQ